MEDPGNKHPRLWGSILCGKSDPQIEVSTVEVGTLFQVPLIIFQNSLPSFASLGDPAPSTVHKMKQPTRSLPASIDIIFGHNIRMTPNVKA